MQRGNTIDEGQRRARRAGRPPNNFDGLRLVAALLVVYGHQTVDRTGTFGLRLLVFFALSGFLISGSWSSDPHPARFLVRRFLRIWPAYAVLIVVCATASFVFATREMPEIARLASVFYLQNVWSPGFDWAFFPGRTGAMNESLWMLPYEIDLYLAFALVAVMGRNARIVAALAAVCLASTTSAPVRAAGGLLTCWSPFYAGFFACGVLLRELPALRRDAVVATALAGGVVLLSVGERSAGLLLVVSWSAVWIGERSWPLLRSAARFGDLSLGVFLWSFPVQQVTRLWLDPGSPLALQLAVVLLQVVPIAWLSSRFVEAPALRRKPGRAGREPAPPIRVSGANAPILPKPASS